MKGFKLTCKIIKKDDHYSLKLPDVYRKLMHVLMKYCFEKKGGFCSFSISPPKRKRSTGQGSQSHHFNGHVQQVAVFTGQPFEDVKKYMKSKAIDHGYPMLEYKDLWGNAQGISEADCSVEECSLLIDAVHQFADEYGIKLDEGYGNE